MRSDPRAVPGDLLLHPVALACLVLLVVNDHLLKGRFPGVVTGKLSDIAGLVVLPLLLASLWEIGGVAAGRKHLVGPRGMLLVCVFTAVGFALVKVIPVMDVLYSHIIGYLRWPIRALFEIVRGRSIPRAADIVVVQDRSDLVAMVAVIVPLLIASRRRVARLGR